MAGKRKPKLPKVVIAALGGLGTLGLVGVSVTAVYANRSLPFLTVSGIKVGNLTRDQLPERLGAILPKPIKVTAEQHSVEITPEAIELRYDAQATAERILALGKFNNLIELKFLEDQPLVFAVNEQKLENLLNQLAAKVDVKARQATVEFKKGELVVLSDTKTGRELDVEQARSQVLKKLAQADFSQYQAAINDIVPTVTGTMLEVYLPELKTRLQSGLTLSYDGDEFQVDQGQLVSFLKFVNQGNLAVAEPNEEKIKGYVKTLAKQIDQSVKDSQLKMVDGRVEVFQASQEGRKLDQNKTVSLLTQAIENEQSQLTLPVKITPASVTTASVNELGIQEIIGKGTTNFKGSPENRKHNISNGAGFLNGVLIAPGQVFSTVDTLGKIDDTSGYLPELVIRENKTIPEFGGGLCQVSTTLFRAVLNTGLPIVERQNHSWRISYYEPPVGLDATIYLPKPDLKFKNDTPGWVLIQSKIEGTSLTFEFFGTKDGRRSEVSTKTLSSTKPPSAVHVESDTLPRGTTKQVEKPHPGGKAVATYKVYGRDGNLINEQTFSSSYKAVPARFLVGTGEVAAAPAEVPPPSSETPPAQ